MPRNLLILALLLSGTGCSATRPLLSTIVVTPPRLSFRQMPREDSWHWTAVGVTYQSPALIPAPCAPSPVRSMELVTFFEGDECLAPLSPSGLAPAVTTVVLAPPVSAPAPTAPAIVHQETTSRPESAHRPVPSVAPVPTGITPIVQAAVAATSPSEALVPLACSPSPVRPVELVAFIEEDDRPSPLSPSELVPSVTPVVPVLPTIVHLDNATTLQPALRLIPSVAPVLLGERQETVSRSRTRQSSVSGDSRESLTTSATVSSLLPLALEITPMVQTASTSTLSAPPVRVESPSPSESDWNPTTRVALVSPVQTSPVIRCDQAETALPEVRPVMPVESLPQPVLVPSDISELLAEIRNQRQLIEALQRDLTRERSADDAAIEELEAAVENLLVHTETAQRELPTTLRK